MRQCLDERLKLSLAATRMIQIRSTMRVFFALIIMLRDRKPSSSVTFTSHTSMNYFGDRALIFNVFQWHRHARSHNQNSNPIN